MRRRNAAAAATLEISWVRRHFSRRFGASNVALRHPQSVWHNFRAVLADEYVAADGPVTYGDASGNPICYELDRQRRSLRRYEVGVLRVTQGACAIGVAGDRASVNLVNHWVPGGELETSALVSGALAVPFGLYGRYRCDARCAAGPDCASCAEGEHHLPQILLDGDDALKEGDVVTVRVSLPTVSFELNGQPVGTLSAPLDQRAAICVGLMFANDAVAIRRVGLDSPPLAPQVLVEV